MRGARILVLALWVSACSEGPEPAPAPELPEARLQLPDGWVELKMDQRGRAPLPGSEGKLFVSLGDITGGQVLVTISGSDGATLHGPVSLRAGEATPFVLDQRDYRLSVTELHTRLLGEDRATLRLEQGDVAVVDERALIEGLIAAVEGLDGAVFVRNGDEHTSAEAGEHLRGKWEWKADEVHTAEDFIRVAGTGSSMTGRPYLIRFHDGREEPSAQWLSARLAELRGDGGDPEEPDHDR